MGDISGEKGSECAGLDQEGAREAIKDRVSAVGGAKEGKPKKDEKLDTKVKNLKDKQEKDKDGDTKKVMDNMRQKGEKALEKGADDAKGELKDRLVAMKAEGKFDPDTGKCDAKDYGDRMKKAADDMRNFGKEKVDLKGLKEKTSTCAEESVKKAQKVMSTMGSCAAGALEGMADRGFERVKDELVDGVKNSVAECADLGDEAKLEDILTESIDMIKKANESLKEKGVSPKGGKKTFTQGMIQKGKKKDGEAGNMELYKCARKVAPQELGNVRCDLALETMKSKLNCDLRGDHGMLAAFGGKSEDDLKKALQ